MSVKTMVLTNRALIVLLLIRTTSDTGVAALLYMYLIYVAASALLHITEVD